MIVKKVSIVKISFKIILFMSFTFFVCRNYFAQTIFDLARRGTPNEMISLLNNHPEQVNLISDRGSSPLLLAAYYGNNDVARVLIDKGAKMNECYAEGSLVYALIYKNNLELLETILKKGVNVNDTCQFEQFGYPVHFALTLQRYEVIDLLLKNELSLNVLDPKKRTINELLIFYKNPKFDEIFNKN